MHSGKVVVVRIRHFSLYKYEEKKKTNKTIFGRRRKHPPTHTHPHTHTHIYMKKTRNKVMFLKKEKITKQVVSRFGILK